MSEKLFSYDDVAKNEKYLIDLRRSLHKIPELGNDLPLTSAFVIAELTKLGLEVKKAASGFWVDIGNQGPLIALRADMDALPITEIENREYKSKIEGRMHACGHDAHTACLVVCAKILTEKKELAFRARLLFQTGEEGYFGAKILIDADCLNGVSAICGFHSGDLTKEIKGGQAGYKKGTLMASADTFHGTFTGSGGHGSAPDKCIDPISALCQWILALQVMRSRELDQSQAAVISICKIEAGTTHNVIPECAHFSGTARALNSKMRKTIEEKILSSGNAIANLTGTKFHLTWEAGYPCVQNDEVCVEALAEELEAVYGKENAINLELANMGAEDFSYYLEKVPGCFWFANTQNKEKGITAPNHNSAFDVDENALLKPILVNLRMIERLAELKKRI